jgi:hypothetical protein
MSPLPADLPDEVGFGLLNAYLDDLHCGHQPTRQRLVEEHSRMLWMRAIPNLQEVVAEELPSL